jgi:hypothetical protein
MIRKWCVALALALLAILGAVCASAQSLQSLPFHYITTASTNSVLVNGNGQNILKWLVASNPTSSTTVNAWLHFYNKATAPNCGTDVPVMTIMIPPNSATGAGNTALSFDDTRFTAGIGFCVTANPADNDNAIGPSGIVINLGYLWL